MCGSFAAELSVPDLGLIFQMTIACLGSHSGFCLPPGISYTSKNAKWSQHSANWPALKVNTGGFVSLMEIDKVLHPVKHNASVRLAIKNLNLDFM